MARTASVIIVVAALALSSSATLSGQDTDIPGQEDHDPTIRLVPAVVKAGGDLLAHVHITPREEDRRLIVAIEAMQFYSRTVRQLRGDDSARLHQFRWRALPADTYVITVQQAGATGEDRGATHRFTVQGAHVQDCNTASGMVPAMCRGNGVH